MTLIFFTTLSLLAYAVVLRRRGTVPGVCHPAALGSASGGERVASSHAASVEASARRDDYISLLPNTRWEWFAVYAPMALATLVKGPIGAILPACGMGLFLILSQPDPVALPEKKNVAKTRGQRLRRWATAAWRSLAHYAAKDPGRGLGYATAAAGGNRAGDRRAVVCVGLDSHERRMAADVFLAT